MLSTDASISIGSCSHSPSFGVLGELLLRAANNVPTPVDKINLEDVVP